MLKKGRNETVEPCNDFYSYVCGNWSNNFPIPEFSDYIDIQALTVLKLRPILKGF